MRAGVDACHMSLKDRCETEFLKSTSHHLAVSYATLIKMLMEENGHETHVFFSPRD